MRNLVVSAVKKLEYFNTLSGMLLDIRIFNDEKNNNVETWFMSNEEPV